MFTTDIMEGNNIPDGLVHARTRLVALESGLGLESGLKSFFAGLGLWL